MISTQQLSEFISVFIPVIIALITVVTPLVFHKVGKMRKEEKLALLLSQKKSVEDCLTLLSIEEELCEMLKHQTGKSNKNTARATVCNLTGRRPSSSCNPVRLERKLNAINKEIALLSANPKTVEV